MQEFLARLDPWARKVGGYTAYTISKREYIGNAPYAVPTRPYLLRHGYERLRLLEAAKFHWDTGDVHDFSYRKVDQDNPRWQWHIHGWFNDAETPKDAYYSLASHYELRPDPRPVADESFSDMVARLREHYRPERGETYKEGDACDAVTELTS